MSGLPLNVPEQGDFGAALGAARLAEVAATGCDLDKVMTSPGTDRIIAPRTDLAEAFESAYRAFRAAYSGIRAIQ